LWRKSDLLYDAGMAAPARDPEPFWVFLNRWLREHNWTQVRLADAVGVHETVVGRWLHADDRRRARPGRQTLPRLSEALGVPMQDLVVMLIADQTRTPEPSTTAARSQLATRLQAVQEQYERWIAAVGIEHEGYFWQHLKTQGDSTVALMRGLGTAVSTSADTAVNAAVSESVGTDERPDDGSDSELSRSYPRPTFPLIPSAGNLSATAAA